MKKIVWLTAIVIFTMISQRSSAQCLVSAANITLASCNQNNGVVELTFNGGTPPYSVNFNGLPLGTLSNTLQISGLGPGTYGFSVTDINNTVCTGDVSVMVSSILSFPPQISISSVPPSCDTCMDGSIIAMVTGIAPFTYMWSNGSTTSNQYNLPCGLYNLVVTDANGCSTTVAPMLNCAGAGTHYLRGKTFYDVNNDSVYNVGDYPLSNQTVQLLPTNLIVYSNLNGDYSFLVDTGSYQLAFVSQSNSAFQHAVVSDTLTVNVTNQSILNLDFALLPDSASSDYTVFSNFWLPRCNSIQSLITAVTNNGTTIDSLNVHIVFPASVGYQNSTSLALVNGDTLIYPLNAVLPGQTVYLYSSFLLPSAGSQLSISSFVSKIDSNNIATSFDTTTTNTQIICGCDPNDKQVSPQVAFVGIDKTLNYLIRFQNTGNDTTFKVVVIDTLDAQINPNSFKLIAYSHPCQVIKDGNILQFVFDNILLPDSNTNEAESHGYVFFSTDVNDNSNSMSIQNKAHIYFDANADVETPYAYTSFVVCVGVSEVLKNGELEVFPNPTSEFINLNFEKIESHQYYFSLYNSAGQLLISKRKLDSEIIKLPSDLVKGIYLLEVTDNTTNKSYHSKIQIK